MTKRKFRIDFECKMFVWPCAGSTDSKYSTMCQRDKKTERVNEEKRERNKCTEV